MTCCVCAGSKVNAVWYDSEIFLGLAGLLRHEPLAAGANKKIAILGGDENIGTPHKMPALSVGNILIISYFLLNFRLKAFVD